MSQEGQHRFAALILAAGASTRLGQPKQLLHYRGERLVGRAVRLAREAGATTVYTVLGASYPLVLEAVSSLVPPVRVLLNQAWSQGMGSSLAVGAAAAAHDGATDLLVMTCDQIHVTAAHLLLLVAASHPDRITASGYGGRLGVPALFPASSFPALQQLHGDRGARDLLQQQGVLSVPLAGGEMDIDTPEDLQALRSIGAETLP